MELPPRSHICFPVPLTRAQMQVTHKSEFNRRRASSDLEDRADEIWNRRISENPHLFNGTKFRYAGLCVAAGRVLSEGGLRIVLPAEGKLSVNLRAGFGSYKEYLSTNLAGLAEELAKYGADKYQDSQACMGDIVGHSALLLTADNYVVIQLRSQLVGEAAGMWHFPGGHPEPEEMGIGSAGDLARADPAKVVEEIYASVLREMKEELNMTEELMSEPRLLCLGKDKSTSYKPELNFLLHTPLLAHQLSDRYHAEGFQDDESDDIGFWDLAELKVEGRASFQLNKFKSRDSEVVSVSRELLANSSLQLINSLPTLLQHNPQLFNL